MRRFLHYAGLIPAIIFIVSPFILSLNGCSNNNYKGGNLPDSFSWAYGDWVIEETFTKREEGHYPNYKEHFFCIIGKDYIQIMNNSQLAEYAFPYIELMPKSSFSVKDSNPLEEIENNDNDVITLLYTQQWGYDGYLYLNKKNKTISTYDNEAFERWGIINQTRRNKEKAPKEVLAEYENTMSSCPIVGDWKSVNMRTRGLDREYIRAISRINIDSEMIEKSFILKQDGIWDDYFGDYEYSYDAKKDRITMLFPESDTDSPVIATYKRYDAEQERLDEIKQILTSKAFSRMQNDVYSNSTLSHVFRFKSDGTGTSTLYEVQPFGKRRIGDASNISWEIVEDKIRVYTEGLSGYSSFTIKQDYSGSSLVESGSGEVYN